MIAVIFEMALEAGQKDAYLDMAARMRAELDNVDGFISIERFESLTTPGKLVSLSFWRDRAALDAWRQHAPHRKAQALGRKSLFSDYRLRVADVLRDYGKYARDQAPRDSRDALE